MHPQSPPEEPLSYQETLDKREERGFAQSTVEATIWLICQGPKRLPAWLARQPNADALEKVARAQIKNMDAANKRHSTLLLAVSLPALNGAQSNGHTDKKGFQL
jgi:hypothetical protein